MMDFDHRGHPSLPSRGLNQTRVGPISRGANNRSGSCMSNIGKKSQFFLYLFLVLLIVAGALTYHERQKFDIPGKLRKLSGRKLPQAGVQVYCIAKVGEKLARFQLYVPCKNPGLKEELNKKMPMINHDLIDMLEQQSTLYALEARDFEVLRKRLLGVVNGVTDRSVPELYFQYFFYN
jgi:hypothetical protein